MMSFGLFWLGALAVPGLAAPTGAPAVADDPAIRLWINNDRQFREGEEARVQVETSRDGYLVVFNFDTEGHLRVLFPLSPRDDNFVHGGHKYEVRGRGDEDASFIAAGEGEGLVYAAVSEDRIRVDDMSVGGNWDYNRISLRNSRDPEAEITDFMQSAVSDRGFDYDVISYRVYGGNYRSATAYYARPYGYYNDYYCDYYYRPSLFGCSYYPNGVSIGLYGYSPFGFGFSYPYYFPYYRNRFFNRNYPVVIGRPRGYTIGRRSFGYDRGGRGTGGFPSRSARPSGDGGRGGRPSGGSWGGRPRGGGGRRSHDDLNNGAPIRSPNGFDGRARRVEIPEHRSEAGRGEARPNIEYRPRSDRSVTVPPARRASVDEGPRIERSRGWDGPRSGTVRSVERPRSSPPPARVERSQPAPRSEGARSSGGGGGGGSHAGRPHGRP